jgi:hypothetical protein
MSFLENPIWQGVGALATIVSLLLYIYIEFFKDKNSTKKPEVISSTIQNREGGVRPTPRPERLLDKNLIYIMIIGGAISIMIIGFVFWYKLLIM